jgi:5'-phosphate synthase pdxT subunit
VVKLDGSPTALEMVFIRAPRIRRVGPGVQILAEHGGEPVMAREGRVLVATFHPELTDSTAVHRYFCELVSQSRIAP